MAFSFFLSINSLYITFLEKGIGLYGGLFHVTATTQIFNIFIFLVSAVILQLTGFYPRKVWVNTFSSLKKFLASKFNYVGLKITNKTGEQFTIIEYSLIILFIITGATFLMSSSDIVSIFLSIELQSYGLYLLCSLYRNSELSTSAGLTYFLLGGLSSCFILLGTGLLYVNSGTTNLDNLYIITNLFDMAKNNSNSILYWYEPYYLNFSLIIMSVGFLFKVSAAPFHLWSPYVYDAIPTIVTTFVAIIPKISIFIFLLEIVHYVSNSFFGFQFSWTSSLLISSLLSLIIGTVVGLKQFRIKRLFAYSTISHLGFILLALSINSVESIQAFIFYLMQYSISNLAVFMILISIGYSLYYYINNDKEYSKLLDKINSPIQLVSQLKGYYFINPILAISLTIVIFSFVGIPPLIGFFAKQMVLSAALESGYVFLALVGILTSVIGAVYYLGIIKQIFFDKHDYKLNPLLNNIPLYVTTSNNIEITEISFEINNITLSSSLTIPISVSISVILLFIFTPQEWLSMSNLLALLLFNP